MPIASAVVVTRRGVDVGQPAADGRDILAYTAPRRIPQLAIAVGGIEVTADIDTGAMGGIALPMSLAEELDLSAAPKVIGRAMTVSGPMEVSEAPLNGVVKIGRHVVSRPALEFTPAMTLGNLGIDLLSEFALTFDQKSQRVRFAREGDSPITLARSPRR